jgi:lysophospholipase L1-like esterase
VPSHLTASGTFTAGETVEARRDGQPPAVSTAIANNDGSVMVAGLLPEVPYRLVGLTSGKAVNVFAETAKQGSGPNGLLLPPDVHGAQAAYNANQPGTLVCVTIPPLEKPAVATGLGFVVNTAAGGDDLVQLGIGEVRNGGVLPISRSGQLAGRLNYDATTPQIAVKKYTPAIPRAQLEPDVPYVALYAQVGQAAGAAALQGFTPNRIVYAHGGPARATVGDSPAPLVKTASVPIPGGLITQFTPQATVPVFWLSFQRRIVCLGDSITTSGSATQSDYPTALDISLGPYAYVINAGVGGDTAVLMAARLAADVTEQIPFEVLVMAGVNDIQGGASAATIQTRLTTLYDGIVAAGGMPRLFTIAPFGLYVGWTAPLEAIRVAVNTWIKGTGYPYVDLDADATYTDNSTPSQPKMQAAIDSGDGLHPNAVGGLRLAELAFQRFFASKRTAKL